MIDPGEIAHPIDIRSEFSKEFKEQVKLEAYIATWSDFSLISGFTDHSDLRIRIRLRDETCEPVQEQHIPLSQKLIKEKTPYEY